MNTLWKDKAYLENKYHDTSKPYDPYRRMEYHGWPCDNGTGMDDDSMRKELDALVTQGEARGESHMRLKARAVAYVLDHARFDISPHDYFVYFYSWGRLVQPSTQYRWSDQVLKDQFPEINALMEDLNNSGAVSIWPDYDHVVPGWDSVMTLGFLGLLKRAQDYRELHCQKGTLTEKAAELFDAIEIEYRALLGLLKRMRLYAQKKAEEKQEKAAEIAQCLSHLETGAPQNTYEALQAIYLFFIVCECVDCFQTRSLGNGLDSTLYPFYTKDLESGAFTREELREYIGYFLMQYAAIDNYWGHPMYLGGTDGEGHSKVNDLTYDILRVYRELQIYNPKIQVKINRNSPEPYVRETLEMVRTGNSSLVFCCEPGMRRAMMNYGVPYEKTLDFDIRGCYETGVRSDEVSTGTGYINPLKAVRYVLTRGFDEQIGKPLGLDTGDLDSFPEFADFYAAFLRQWGALIDKVFLCADAYEPYLSEMNPSPFYSATVTGSLKKGVDGYTGGVRYNNSCILNCGLASAVDALMAVREMVYEKKRVSLSQLKEALEADWQGYEMLRQEILRSPHKYGNGDPITDAFAGGLSRWYCTRVDNRPNQRGGVYKAILHSAMQFIWQGQKTGATPDGRHAGEEISKNGSPAPGMDKKGVTALLRSVCDLEPTLYTESSCVDVMLHPSAVQGEDGMKALKGLLDYYMEHGGMAIQFNIFSPEMLMDAQKHPDKYRSLQVRVCGWNVLWNSLSTTEQNAYIRRAQNVRND